MNTTFLIENADLLFETKNADYSVLSSIKDESYLMFIRQINGGYFFNKSLLIYGLGDVPAYASFTDMNLLVNGLYNSIAPKAYYLGCDFLGNQFAFFNDKVCFFNIETAEYEVLANTFEDWLTLIYNDLNYYTGQPLVLKWESENRPIAYDERLCAKKPFTLGGDYVVPNLYALNIEKVINYNFDIAKQIYLLPDGTKLKLKIED